MQFAKVLKSAALSASALFSLVAAQASFAPAALADPGLAYDGDHDVLILPDCDVAVRYNNKTFVPVKAVSTLDSPDFS